MSATQLLLPKKNAARRAMPAQSLEQMQAEPALRSAAEDLLRELAFVYQAVRVVEQAITARPKSEPAGAGA